PSLDPHPSLNKKHHNPAQSRNPQGNERHYYAPSENSGNNKAAKHDSTRAIHQATTIASSILRKRNATLSYTCATNIPQTNQSN
ncbi:hypothetical protein AAHH78_35915, partial [Burkholderia pseudomallei]